MSLPDKNKLENEQDETFSYFKPYLINSKIFYPPEDDDLDINAIFHSHAPIAWKKDDIEQMLINQVACQEEKDIFLKLHELIYLTYKNSMHLHQNSSYVSDDFYKNHSSFLQTCDMDSKHIQNFISGTVSEMLSAFSEICSSKSQFLTIDKVILLITDFNKLALAMKREYLTKAELSPKYYCIENQFIDNSREILFLVNLFFDVLDNLYPEDIDDTFGKEFYNKWINTFGMNFKKYKEQLGSLLLPFEPLTKTSAQIPSALSPILFAYFSIFPIIEVLISEYFEHHAYSKIAPKGAYSIRNLKRRNLYLITIYRLLVRLPVLMKKYQVFINDFELALSSFVNICWFVKIFRSNNVSWLDEIILKMFEERLKYAITMKDDKHAKIEIHSEEQKMISMFSLFTNIDGDLQEKLKSISAFCKLKVS